MNILTRSCRVLTADERLARWYYRFYASGCHHVTRKPRIRVKPRIRIQSNTVRGGSAQEIS